MPLAEREIALGRSRRSFIPALILLGAMLLIGFHVVPVAIAFFGAVVVLLTLRVMSMGEA